MTLRRATPADAEAVRTLSRAAYAQWVPLIGREPKPMTADYDHAVRAHIIDLHETDGVLDGLIEMIPAPDHLLVENVAVRPGGQGRGLGAALMRHAETLAATLGLPELRLYTNGAFASNIAFYERRGYQVTAREPFPAGGIIVHMRKALSPP
jgi:GNAT superfamily N-acetyltransferase